MTDRAIHTYRDIQPDQMIVHYLQPHFPSIPRPEFDSGAAAEPTGDAWKSVWTQVAAGTVDLDPVIEAYYENLEYVLEDVDRLLRNIEAERVAITSDHGNAIGELGYYGHGVYFVDALREVPWCVRSAQNTAQDTVEPPEPTRDEHHDVADQLRSLGYKA